MHPVGDGRDPVPSFHGFHVSHAGLCLKGRRAIGSSRAVAKRLQSGCRAVAERLQSGCRAVAERLQSGHGDEMGMRKRLGGGGLLAVGNAVGTGVGVWECLQCGVRPGVLGGGSPPAPFKRFPDHMRIPRSWSVHAVCIPTTRSVSPAFDVDTHCLPLRQGPDQTCH